MLNHRLFQSMNKENHSKMEGQHSLLFFYEMKKSEGDQDKTDNLNLDNVDVFLYSNKMRQYV